MDRAQTHYADIGVYSDAQVSAWLHRISLPKSYRHYIDNHSAFPKTEASLRVLFQCQITTFPYENLSVHYSKAHQVDIRPIALFEKMMAFPEKGRGGYCMELSIFFHYMLRRLGFCVYMTGVRNRTRSNGRPQGEYQGWTHIINIILLSCGSNFSADVAFGGDGPTSPLRMDGQGLALQNLGTQQVRLCYGNIPKQRLGDPKLWIYQYRNNLEQEWRSFYSFAELEFFQGDFEVQNWWASAKTLHRWTVLAVRFLRDGEPITFLERGSWDSMEGDDLRIAGKIMMINNVVKLNMGGKTGIIQSFTTEKGRLKALRDYFGIYLTEEEAGFIKGWDTSLKY